MKCYSQTPIKNRTCKHDHNVQELWDMSKTPNQRTYGTEEGGEMMMITKGTENLLNKIVPEKNFQNLEKPKYAFRIPTRYDHESQDVKNAKQRDILKSAMIKC